MTVYRVRYECGIWPYVLTEEVTSREEALELVADALADPSFVTLDFGEAVTVDRIRGAQKTRMMRWEWEEGRWVRRHRPA